LVPFSVAHKEQRPLTRYPYTEREKLTLGVAVTTTNH